MEKLWAFLGGMVMGAAIGMAVFANPELLEAAAMVPPLILVAVAVACFLAGFMVNMKKSAEELPMQGRVFPCPQAPVLVEVALKRMGSIMGEKK